MQVETTTKNSRPSKFSLRGDINGLVLVLGVLVALMLLPGPTEADYKARDIQMNDIVRVTDFKK